MSIWLICPRIVVEISRYLPHEANSIKKLVPVPETTKCLPSSLGVMKGASWLPEVNDVLLRLFQTGHDQKFLYR